MLAFLLSWLRSSLFIKLSGLLQYCTIDTLNEKRRSRSISEGLRVQGGTLEENHRRLPQHPWMLSKRCAIEIRQDAMAHGR